MQIALRPVAVRALLLVLGVALGLLAFLAAFNAVGSSSASDHSVLGGNGHTVTARGVGWI